MAVLGRVTYLAVIAVLLDIVCGQTVTRTSAGQSDSASGGEHFMGFRMSNEAAGSAGLHNPFNMNQATVQQGKAFGGIFRGSCESPNIIYAHEDMRSLVQCSNGYAYKMPCAPGTAIDPASVTGSGPITCGMILEGNTSARSRVLVNSALLSAPVQQLSAAVIRERPALVLQGASASAGTVLSTADSVSRSSNLVTSSSRRVIRVRGGSVSEGGDNIAITGGKIVPDTDSIITISGSVSGVQPDGTVIVNQGQGQGQLTIRRVGGSLRVTQDRGGSSTTTDGRQVIINGGRLFSGGRVITLNRTLVETAVTGGQGQSEEEVVIVPGSGSDVQMVEGSVAVDEVPVPRFASSPLRGGAVLNGGSGTSVSSRTFSSSSTSVSSSSSSRRQIVISGGRVITGRLMIINGGLRIIRISGGGGGINVSQGRFIVRGLTSPTQEFLLDGARVVGGRVITSDGRLVEVPGCGSTGITINREIQTSAGRQIYLSCRRVINGGTVTAGGSRREITVIVNGQRTTTTTSGTSGGRLIINGGFSTNREFLVNGGRVSGGQIIAGDGRQVVVEGCGSAGVITREETTSSGRQIYIRCRRVVTGETVTGGTRLVLNLGSLTTSTSTGLTERIISGARIIGGQVLTSDGRQVVVQGCGASGALTREVVTSSGRQVFISCRRVISGQIVTGSTSVERRTSIDINGVRTVVTTTRTTLPNGQTRVREETTVGGQSSTVIITVYGANGEVVDRRVEGSPIVVTTPTPPVRNVSTSVERRTSTDINGIVTVVTTTRTVDSTGRSYVREETVVGGQRTTVIITIIGANGQVIDRRVEGSAIVVTTPTPPVRNVSTSVERRTSTDINGIVTVITTTRTVDSTGRSYVREETVVGGQRTTVIILIIGANGQVIDRRVEGSPIVVTTPTPPVRNVSTSVERRTSTDINGIVTVVTTTRTVDSTGRSFVREETVVGGQRTTVIISIIGANGQVIDRRVEGSTIVLTTPTPPVRNVSTSVERRTSTDINGIVTVVTTTRTVDSTGRSFVREETVVGGQRTTVIISIIGADGQVIDRRVEGSAIVVTTPTPPVRNISISIERRSLFDIDGVLTVVTTTRTLDSAGRTYVQEETVVGGTTRRVVITLLGANGEVIDRRVEGSGSSTTEAELVRNISRSIERRTLLDINGVLTVVTTTRTRDSAGKTYVREVTLVGGRQTGVRLSVIGANGQILSNRTEGTTVSISGQGTATTGTTSSREIIITGGRISGSQVFTSNGRRVLIRGCTSSEILPREVVTSSGREVIIGCRNGQTLTATIAGQTGSSSLISGQVVSGGTLSGQTIRETRTVTRTERIEGGRRIVSTVTRGAENQVLGLRNVSTSVERRTSTDINGIVTVVTTTRTVDSTGRSFVREETVVGGQRTTVIITIIGADGQVIDRRVEGSAIVVTTPTPLVRNISISIERRSLFDIDGVLTVVTTTRTLDSAGRTYVQEETVVGGTTRRVVTTLLGANGEVIDRRVEGSGSSTTEAELVRNISRSIERRTLLDINGVLTVVTTTRTRDSAGKTYVREVTLVGGRQTGVRLSVIGANGQILSNRTEGTTVSISGQGTATTGTTSSREIIITGGRISGSQVFTSNGRRVLIRGCTSSEILPREVVTSSGREVIIGCRNGQTLTATIAGQTGSSSLISGQVVSGGTLSGQTIRETRTVTRTERIEGGRRIVSTVTRGAENQVLGRMEEEIPLSSSSGGRCRVITEFVPTQDPNLPPEISRRNEICDSNTSGTSANVASSTDTSRTILSNIINSRTLSSSTANSRTLSSNTANPQVTTSRRVEAGPDGTQREITTTRETFPDGRYTITEESTVGDRREVLITRYTSDGVVIDVVSQVFTGNSAISNISFGPAYRAESPAPSAGG
ncbi:uncharacterized protein LOC106158043 [Lingula anatina]|uniref:Uncharacterized protein LOC106158043 n=1 Tax=Lingula anatina TaxID=7574 RepID=A0A1S3HTI6_LINAN|nr:uncharacterized protein LOC106158043 [Lingula anatina]|eukprot:XP_013389333.1 uncharacterized protein LOC106158043 [Lingula anatina]